MSEIDRLREHYRKRDAENAILCAQRDDLRAENAALSARIERLTKALSAMTDRWEPDCGGLDRVMWEEAQLALGREIWDRSKTT